MTERIKAENLTFRYPGAEVNVFEDISFSVKQGEVFCLLGPNGTGKSTILKCLCGLLKPVRGDVFLDDLRISKMPPSEIAKKLGYVPQSQEPPFPYPVKEIVVMGRAPHIGTFSAPTEDDRQIAWQAMQTAGVEHLADRPCTSISGGEWQLVLIARALAQQPQILVLDEPTSHLDLGNRMKILSVVKELAQNNMTVLMASHHPEHAFMNSSIAAIMKEKKIMAIGDPSEVVSEENLKSAYGVDVRVMYVGEGVERNVCIPLLNLK